MSGNLWLPPEKIEPSKAPAGHREVRVITYWHDQTEQFKKLCGDVGAQFLGAILIPRKDGIYTEWAALYRHTEDIDMEILC